MQGLRDRVAVVGMGCTKFGELWDKSSDDLLIDASLEAFADAGIEAKQIQAAWVGTYSSFRTGVGLSYPLKLQYVPVTRVENACATGTDAFRNACFAVAAGVYDFVLAAGVEKQKDSGYSGLVANAEVVSSETAPMVPAPTQFALAATRYFHTFGLSFQEGKQMLARIAVKNHHNGTMSPKAHLRREITVEQAINSPMIAWPLGLFDCCGVSDGAAAAVITSPEIAKKLKKDYALVKAVGLTCGSAQGVQQQSFDFVHFEETVDAAKKAYADAGVKDPRREISLAQVHDCFTITEALVCEDLGLADKGHYRDEQNKGAFELTGTLPVNTDGGLKCYGHPIGASGLRMMYENFKQLQGKAGPRQLKNVNLALTHNLGGKPGGRFTCAVSILGRAD